MLLQHQIDGIDFHVGDKQDFVYDILSHPLNDEWAAPPLAVLGAAADRHPRVLHRRWGKAAPHLRGNFYGYERVRGPKKLLVAHPAASPPRSCTTSRRSTTAPSCCPGTTTTSRAPTTA